MDQTSPILIRVAVDFVEIAPRYLDVVRETLVAMRHAFTENDLKIIRTKGHQMKGEGSGFGFEEISKAGKKLEQAAKAGNRSIIEAELLRLADYLARVVIEPGV